MSEETRRQSLFDATSAQELSKSFGQLCSQFSLSNTKVPTFDSSTDVFEFLRQFEVTTIGLEDYQKLDLLTKVFTASQYRSWYETKLAPKIKAREAWDVVRQTIIKRFSDSEERDRYFTKIRDLKYDPNTGQKLQDFIEDMIYSLKKAFQTIDSPLTVKYIKASIPPEARAAMRPYAEFRDAQTPEDLSTAAKLYDLAKVSTNNSANSNSTKELASVIQELVKEIKKDNEDTRKAIVSVFKSNVSQVSRANDGGRQYPSSPKRNEYRPVSPRFQEQSYQSDRRDFNRPGSPKSSYNNRPTSPRREYDYRDRRTNHEDFNDDPSSGRQQGYGSYKQRPQSPRPFYRNDRSVNNRPPTPGAKETSTQEQRGDEVLNSEKYFARFNKPPTPCQLCNGWHWLKHCPFHLN